VAWLTVLGVAVAIGGFVVWWGGRPAEVEVITLAPTTVERALAVVGRARPTDLVSVQSQNAGQIISLLHDDGDVVAAGAPLAIVRAAVERAQVQADAARVRAARAEVRRAQLAFNRTQVLAGKGFAAKAALDEARAALQSAQASLDAATATTAAVVEREKEFTVRAPMAGVVLYRPVDNGQVVGATTTLFQLGSLDGVEIQAQVDEAYADALKVGMAARASPSGANSVFAARVTEVSPQVDSTTGGRLIKLIPVEGPALAPGRSVDVTIVVERLENGLVIPRQSVVDATTAPKVYVVDADDRVQPRRITIARWPSTNAIIQSGLSAGDRVVLNPSKTKPSAHVRPVIVTAPSGG
jgi:RND family efflux transporter MFP subunit